MLENKNFMKNWLYNDITWRDTSGISDIVSGYIEVDRDGKY